jgi:hypothetical protein
MVPPLLSLKRMHFVVGVCGTGQGFLNSVMQYPDVFGGHIKNSLNAWLFAQIRGQPHQPGAQPGLRMGGRRQLALHLRPPLQRGVGPRPPAHRQESQQASRLMQGRIYGSTRLSLAKILESLPEEVIKLNPEAIDDVALKRSLLRLLARIIELGGRRFAGWGALQAEGLGLRRLAGTKPEA